jgi:glycerophosphoryl diester phosphodiesterase
VTLLRWAHQGGAREGPSNTLAAMENAIHGSGRANALEFDVHVTADRPREVVIIHDRRLDRTTNGCGKVAAHSLKQLRQLDAAHWWVDDEVDNHSAPPEAYENRGRAPADRRYGIPTLDEVLDRFDGMPMTIEVKAWRAAAPLVDALAARSRADVTVTSFFDPFLWVVRWRLRRYPGYTLGLSAAMGYILWFRLRSFIGVPPRSSRYTRLQLPIRKLGITFTTQRVVDHAHAAGLAVDVWTLDDAPSMTAVMQYGVDGIMTDRPKVLADVVGA